LGLAIEHLSSTVLSLGMCFYLAWDLTLVSIAAIPLATVVVALFSRRVQPNIDAQAKKLEEASKHAFGAFSAIDSVKCYNGQDFELRKYLQALSEAARFYSRQVLWNSAQGSFLRLTTLAMFVQGFFYGAHLVSSRKKSVGDVMTALWAVMLATSSFMQIMPLVIVLEKGRLAGAKLRAVLTTLEGTTTAENIRRVDLRAACNGDMRVSDVSTCWHAVAWFSLTTDRYHSLIPPAQIAPS
jgi:ATP-binding cassette, subfamily B (MDR/TAP), member 1